MKRRIKNKLPVIIVVVLAIFLIGFRNNRIVKKIEYYIIDSIYYSVMTNFLPYEKVNIVEKEKAVVNTNSSVYGINKLVNYDFAMKHFYVVESSTSLPREKLDLEKMNAVNLTIEKDSDKPQILIFHTHGQERFADSDTNGKSIVDVGKYLTEILENQYGYNVIHLEDSFDLVNGVFDRSKAYEYANARVEELLKENESIEVVIDLHRDGVGEDTRLVTDLDGKTTAKIMLFNGVSYLNSEGELKELSNPYLLENLAMTYKMYLLGEVMYPDYIRCIYVAGYRYCLYHRERSMLVEAGAQTNTYEEVCNAMWPFAELLDKVLSYE